MFDESELKELAAKVDSLRGLGKMSNVKAVVKIVHNIPNLDRKQREEAHEELVSYMFKKTQDNILNFPLRRTGRDRGAESIIVTTDPGGRKMVVGMHRRTSGIERSLPKGNND